MKKAKFLYDKKSDNLYLFIKEGQLDEYQEVAPGVGLEFDKGKNLLGIEVLGASKILGVRPKVDEKILGNFAS